MIRSIQDASNISNHSLTYYEFDPGGRPLVLDNGHFKHVISQPFFFARKVSPTAETLLSEVNSYLQHEEIDLDYFSRVGVPTAAYKSYVAKCLTVSSARSRVASIVDLWRGVMDSNERAYYVIWSSSRDYIQDIIDNLQSIYKGPAYSYLFDSSKMDLGGQQLDRFGISRSMIGRRNLAPDSLLFEATNAHPVLPCIFAIDPADGNWARDFVLWDANATLICCEPERLTKIQRAEAYLRHPRRHWDRSLVRDVYQAAFTNSWLPLEHFQKTRAESSPRCQFLNLCDLQSSSPSEALLSLRAASDLLDSHVYFLTDHIAWANLRKAKLRDPMRHESRP
ncbi:MAG: hypothetical protein U5L74_02315 [Ideonella sp.]|nr:hypothetical protein [Ideonella sp.]